MKVTIFSDNGEFLPIVWRLRREGTDVAIYIHNPRYRGGYAGILPNLTISGLKKRIKETDVVLFDITRPNRREKQDIILLKTFGLKSSMSSVFGPISDKLSKDHKVIGASMVTEELELDRKKGIEVARKLGLAIPEFHDFKDLMEGVRFLENRKDLWVFKPENNQDLDLTYVEKFPGELKEKMLNEWIVRLGSKFDYILQKKIKGIELSSEVWVSDTAEHFNHTIESKRLNCGNLGQAIGSQSNTVFVKKGFNGTISNALTKMASYLKKTGYRGPCDVNCILSGNVPYFLEWTPRFGYDALFCLLTLLKGSITDFLLKDKVDFYNGYACSQRITIPPFPYSSPSLLKNFAKDVVIKNRLESVPFFWGLDIYSDIGKIKCTGADGILGVVCGRGDNPEQAWGRVYSNIDKLKTCSYLQYRTDGFRDHIKRLKELKVA
jgi:phosphoribosylamine-glycine ligase